MCIFNITKVADSFNKLYHGVQVMIGGKHRTVRGMVTQFRGDWKWHRATGPNNNVLAYWNSLHIARLCHRCIHSIAKEWFSLQAWWRATQLCHQCFSTKHDFLKVPNPLPQLPRRDLHDFMENAIKSEELSHLFYCFAKCRIIFFWGAQGPLTTIEYFDPSAICYCSMHSLNLGYALWVSASVLILMVEHYEMWGSDDIAISERYKSAWLNFNAWCVGRRIQQLSTWVLISVPNLTNKHGKHLHGNTEAFPGGLQSKDYDQCAIRAAGTACQSIQCHLPKLSALALVIGRLSLFTSLCRRVWLWAGSQIWWSGWTKSCHPRFLGGWTEMMLPIACNLVYRYPRDQHAMVCCLSQTVEDNMYPRSDFITGEFEVSVGWMVQFDRSTWTIPDTPGHSTDIRSMWAFGFKSFWFIDF